MSARKKVATKYDLHRTAAAAMAKFATKAALKEAVESPANYLLVFIDTDTMELIATTTANNAESYSIDDEGNLVLEI